MDREAYKNLRLHVLEMISIQPLELQTIADELGIKRKNIYHLLYKLQKEYNVKTFDVNNGKKGFKRFYTVEGIQVGSDRQKYSDLKGDIWKSDLLTWFNNETIYDQNISSHELVQKAKKFGQGVRVFDFVGDRMVWL